MRASLSLLLLLLCVVYGWESSPIWHVRLVDSWQGKNFLFRGAMPETPNSTVGSAFNYSALLSSMQSALEHEGNKFFLPSNPDDIDLVVVNLENLVYNDRFGYDAWNVVSEHDFFASHPNAGQFFFWHTVGINADPTNPYLMKSRDWMAQSMDTWDSDRLTERLAQLRLWLRQDVQKKRSRVIYFHCACGCDRTGEVAGAYGMAYLNKTMDEMVSYNNAIEPPPPGLMECQNLWAMQWYCFRLNKTSTGYCGKTYPCDASGFKKK